MEIDKIQLSVALVTRNRPDSLERTLKSLRAQDVQPWEVIVSDDSDPEWASECQRVAAAYKCKYLAGPQRGLYANRNHVAAACGGTHIRTMDDDHEFPAGHIQVCLNAVAEDAASVWIIGEYNPGQTPNAIAPCPGQLTASGVSETPDDTQNCWAFSDGASILPRQIFASGIHYMDRYKFGAAYLEFGSRLHWLGYRIRHLESTYVIHHFNPLARSFMNTKIDLASRIFAMLCHSYVYQPKLKNKILCSLTLIRSLLLHGEVGIYSTVDGWNSYKKHRRIKI